MTPTDKTKAASVALIYLERALAQAVDEEALYRDLLGREAEYALAARLVTLIEADLAEVERLLARHTEQSLRAAFATSVVEANTRPGQGLRHVRETLRTLHVHGQEVPLIPDDEEAFEAALSNVIDLDRKGTRQ